MVKHTRKLSKTPALLMDLQALCALSWYGGTAGTRIAFGSSQDSDHARLTIFEDANQYCKLGNSLDSSEMADVMLK